MMRENVSGKFHIKFRQARRFRRQMTDSEKLLWSRLRGNRLLGLHFRRQHVIRGFIVDFYCHAAKLVVEIDGRIHEERADADPDRDILLISTGLTVLHLPASMVERRLEEAVQAIEAKCRESLSGSPATALCPI